VKPLVSILIPACNAESWIAYTFQFAVGQTWPRKKIIGVNVRFKDATVGATRRFAFKNIKVLSTHIRGQSREVARWDKAMFEHEAREMSRQTVRVFQ
jgi:hypothetical protein